MPVFAILFCLLAAPFPPAAPTGSSVFESPAGTAAVSGNQIDGLVGAKLRQRGIEESPLCSDEVFVRRVFVDAIGAIPEPGEVRAFLADRRPGKRAALIDSLLARDEHADYWAMKWCDVLRVKSEFPVNLWPNAVQAYHRWVRDSVRNNMPYDRFARELLTSSGSNFRVPPVNFYRAPQGRKPAGIAEAVGITFLGVRLDKWPEPARAGLASFFSRIQFKPTGEWKEEIIQLDPAPAQPLRALLPDGTALTIDPDRDPRVVFADWLLARGNPWFARCAANRTWAWLVGRGIVNEPDDFRPDNPPSNPELLAYLADELARTNYDMRHLKRLILNSRTYQRSSIPRGSDPGAEALFAFYPVRRLDAEILADALIRIGGGAEDTMSPIPEPFTFVPSYQHTVALADGSISTPFLELFGRPSRDTGLDSERNNQPSEAQRMYLLNSTQLERRLARSERLRTLVRNARGNPRLLVQLVYQTILSRNPSPGEEAIALEHLAGPAARQREGMEDLAWALINTKEFLYRH